MKLKAAICDDDPEIHTLLTLFFQQYSIAYDHEFQLHHYYSGEELLAVYPREQSFHLLFLDVEMREKNGIEVAENIRKLPDKNIIIIFLSSYPRYMQDCFPVHAHRFFVKPITYEYFSEQLTQVLNEIRNTSMQLVLMRCNREEIVINLSDLVYIQVDKHFSASFPLAFHTRCAVYHCKGHIADWEKKLQKQYFVSPIRGYLLNLRFIYRFLDSTIETSTHEQIPLTSRKEKEIKKLFQNYILSARYFA